MKIKAKHGHVLCVVLKENKSIVFENVSTKKDSFRIDKSVYFLENTGSYISDSGGILCSVYLEGISLPVSHKYIVYEYTQKEFFNETLGKNEKHKIKQIKNLDFDSKAIHIILNQKLAEMFTRIPMDMPNIILALLLLASVVIGVINIGMWFL